MNSTHVESSSSENNAERIEPEEIEIPVPWGHISGLWWGSKETMPILALHGWQDNAGTYDKLAPILAQKIAILSIDLSGHGRSSHLLNGSFYYVFWDGVILIRRIVKYYKWDKFVHMMAMGKWWGPKKMQPIITLHGRQDNAGSFDRIVSLICKNTAFLCLDLPGHGFSSHFPNGQYYFVYWDGLMMLRRIVKHYRWSKIKILGHSLGGAIGFLYATTYPDDVDVLMCLDIVSPTVRNTDQVVDETGSCIEKYLKYEKLTLDSVPCYHYDEMINIVVDAYAGSITRESAEILMRRGMQPALIKDKYYFSRDPKLKVALLGMLSLELTAAYAKQMKCNYLNIRAVPGLKLDHPEYYHNVLDIIKSKVKRFEYHEVEGTHHVHLNEPEKIAPIIEKFLGL